jgi:hypothetical protein
VCLRFFSRTQGDCYLDIEKPLCFAAIELIDHLRSMGETNAVRERILVRSYVFNGLLR